MLANKKGEKVMVQKVLDGLCGWINKLKEIGDMIIQYDPGHAALLWAALRFFLTVSSATPLLMQVLIEDHNIRRLQ